MTAKKVAPQVRRAGSPTSRASGQRQLTPARIVAAAIAYADAEGLPSLTTRALAGRLGVEAMALYYYFKSKDALLDAMTEGLERQARPSELVGDWRSRLKAIAAHQIDVALAHPRLAPLMAARRGTTDAVFANNEDVLSCLLEAGLDRPARIVWLRAFAALVNGLALYFAAPRAPVVNARSIDSKRFPLVAEAVSNGKRIGPHASLERGVAAFVEAITIESGRDG